MKNTGFITGLLSGLDSNQKEETYKLNERKARGAEIDVVQREARRVADADAIDEQNTMTQLMNPGLHPDSRTAIVQARLNRRQQSQSYIQSLQGDPDKSKDIQQRYGDLSQMLAPSAIGAGTLPKPTMDMNSILAFLDKSNTSIRGMGDPAFKQTELERRRGIATDIYGAPESLVDRYLPKFGSKSGSTPGKVGDWQSINDIAGLDPSLQQGGSMQQPGGMTLETAMQGGELMKRYKQPDTDIFETYQQPEEQVLKMKKLKMDLPMIQARIDQIKAKTAAIPEEVKIKYGGLLEKIKDNKIKNSLRASAIDISREANGIRLWGLQNTHQRGMMGLGIRQAQFGLNVQKAEDMNVSKQIARLDKLGAALDKHIGASAKAVTLGQPQVNKAEDAMARALKSQIDNAKAYLQNSGNEDYNDAFVDNELQTGGFQRPSRMMGGQYSGMGLANPGDVNYQYGNYPPMNPQGMANLMGRGMGYNLNEPSPVYMGGGAGVNPGAYVQTPAPSPQTTQVTLKPNGVAFVTPQKNPMKLRSTGSGTGTRIPDYVTGKK
jgi:hypothetical protein